MLNEHILEGMIDLVLGGRGGGGEVLNEYALGGRGNRC